MAHSSTDSLWAGGSSSRVLFTTGVWYPEKIPAKPRFSPAGSFGVSQDGAIGATFAPPVGFCSCCCGFCSDGFCSCCSCCFSSDVKVRTSAEYIDSGAYPGTHVYSSSETDMNITAKEISSFASEVIEEEEEVEDAVEEEDLSRGVLGFFFDGVEGDKREEREPWELED